MGRARRGRAAAKRRRLVPSRVPRRGDRQLVPGARHGAGQRGGHRRGAQRARQPPRVQAAARSSGCCASPKYAERLLDDLDLLDWPESIKIMQRNWIGRSEGADIVFPVERPRRPRHPRVHDPPRHRVRRHLHGARAGVGPRRRDRPATSGLAERRARRGGDLRPRRVAGRGGRGVPRVRGGRRPTSSARPKARRRPASSSACSRSTRSTTSASRSSSPTTCWPATAPAPSWRSPARTSATGTSPRSSTSRSSARCSRRADFDGQAYLGDGPAINSGFLDGLERRRRQGARSPSGSRRRASAPDAVTYKLRDWLFSRQRYWGEPFPIVYDETGLPVALPESMLPVELPEMSDFEPQHRRRRRGDPARAAAGARRAVGHGRADLGDGPKTYVRETNTMPQWAGSCWYYLRYLDPTNENELVEPEVERYWMQAGHPLGRCRPLRRRRRARGVAPPLRTLLAQGPVRPRPRVDAGAVRTAVQPGNHHCVRVRRRARCVRRRQRGRGA